VTLLEQSNYNKSLPTKIFAHGWVGFPDQGYGSKNGEGHNKLGKVYSSEKNKICSDPVSIFQNICCARTAILFQ
jgi:hypothetical protein